MRRRGTTQEGESDVRSGHSLPDRPGAERRDSIPPPRFGQPSGPGRSGPSSEPSPAPRSAASRKVRTIDVLVQGATVELFHFYGVAIAPADNGESRDEALVHSDPVSTVEFSAPGFSGLLALSAHPGVFRAMTGLPPALDSVDDWMREVVNQLMGKVKSRLARFQIALHAELPQLRRASDVARRYRGSKQQFCYAFRTLKGEVVVTLGGDFDESSLVFSNSSPLPLDGKVILF